MTEADEKPRNSIQAKHVPKIDELLDGMAEKAPDVLPRSQVLGQRAEKIRALLDKGWSAEAICDALADVVPGLTPAALRYAIKPPRSRKQRGSVGEPSAQPLVETFAPEGSPLK